MARSALAIIKVTSDLLEGGMIGIEIPVTLPMGLSDIDILAHECLEKMFPYWTELDLYGTQIELDGVLEQDVTLKSNKNIKWGTNG